MEATSVSPGAREAACRGRGTGGARGWWMDGRQAIKLPSGVDRRGRTDLDAALATQMAVLAGLAGVGHVERGASKPADVERDLPLVLVLALAA